MPMPQPDTSLPYPAQPGGIGFDVSMQMVDLQINVQ